MRVPQNFTKLEDTVNSIKPYRSVKPRIFFSIDPFPRQSCQTKIFTSCLLIFFRLNTNLLSFSFIRIYVMFKLKITPIQLPACTDLLPLIKCSREDFGD